MVEGFRRRIEGKHPGLFVTLEGIEGSGKSTLSQALVRELNTNAPAVVTVAEPGGGGLGSAIRSLLLDSADSINSRAELLLFEAARASTVDSIIVPALNDGSVVICDRYVDSTTAYQGHARGIDLELVERLNWFATRGLLPDLTILLDLPTQTGLARQRLIDRISSEDTEFHERVRQGYLSIAESERDRVVVLDATQPFEIVFESALATIRRALVQGK